MCSFGIKAVCVLAVLAGSAGVMIGYAVEGGSLLAALIIAGLIAFGTLLVVWWLIGKTDLNREWSRTRSGSSQQDDDNTRQQ
jgi:hypothetical protein